MAAASQEFSRTYQSLAEELGSFRAKNGALKAHVSRLFEENRRLGWELREAVAAAADPPAEGDHLRRQLADAVAAKDAAVQLWQESLRQLESREEQLLGRRSASEEERGESDRLLRRLQEEYARGLNVLSAELEDHRDHLARAGRDLRAGSAQVDALRAELEAERAEKARLGAVAVRAREAEAGLASAQALLSETETFLTVTREEAASLKRLNAELTSQVADLRDQNRKVRDAALVFERDAKESLRKAQEAVLQKKEAAYREQELLKEISHLKASVDLEAEKITTRHRATARETAAQFEARTRVLMEEIEALHQDVAERQGLFERATRERQALESKLELLQSECSDALPNRSLEELCRRLAAAERSRDELEFKVKSLETDLSELRSVKDQEAAVLQEANSKLASRCARLAEDYGDSSGERIRLGDEAAALRKRCGELDKALRSSREREARELDLCTVGAREKEKALTEKLRGLEEHYSRKVDDLQDLLDAQFRIGVQWKEEVDAVILKSEVKIKELCRTIVDLQNQNKELCDFIVRR